MHLNNIDAKRLRQRAPVSQSAQAMVDEAMRLHTLKAKSRTSDKTTVRPNHREARWPQLIWGQMLGVSRQAIDRYEMDAHRSSSRPVRPITARSMLLLAAYLHDHDGNPPDFKALEATAASYHTQTREELATLLGNDVDFIWRGPDEAPAPQSISHALWLMIDYLIRYDDISPDWDELKCDLLDYDWS